MENTAYFKPSGPSPADDIVAALDGALRLREEKPVTRKETYFDTFDYRLHHAGLLLTREGKRFLLRQDGRDKPLASVTLKAGEEPRFPSDFPAVKMREELEKVMDVRAVMPVISVRRSVAPFRVLNGDEKTVAWLRLVTLAPDGEENDGDESRLLEIEPVRGYAGDADSVKKAISEIGLVQTEGGLLSAALFASGRAITDYSPKVSVSLHPDMPAHEALRMIFSSLVGTMRVNESGILEDIDTEFLHDFRVSVRRTRSALTLTKGIYPAETAERFKNGFRTLGRMTNRLRDLDIYLLGKDEYLGMVSPSLKSGVEKLFGIIGREREEARAEFERFMGSREYRDILGSWEAFLASRDSEGVGGKADAPVITLARKRIKRRYAKVLSFGAGINDASPDEDLHTLRIECKKLRYYIEFFESLFPEAEVKQAIKHLKGLQDNLGDINDLRVQQESIKGFVADVEPGSRDEKEMIASAGGLISQLYSRQRERRAEFSAQFADFSGDETSALFDKLLSGN